MRAAACSAALVLAVGSCDALADASAESLPTESPLTQSLYARIGGAPVMTLLVDDYFEQVTRDPVLRESFIGVDKSRLKDHVQAFLCAAAGGGCRYEGDNMKTVHAGMGITERQMNRFVELLIESLDRNGVGLREKNELLAVLAPYKRDVVSP